MLTFGHHAVPCGAGIEALAAVGLASSLLSFIDAANKIISTAKEIHASNSGAADSDQELRLIADILKERALELKSGPAASKLGPGPQKLRDFSSRCQRLAEDLLKFLDKFKSDRPHSKIQSSKIALNRVWRATERSELEETLQVLSAELDRYTQAAFQSEVRQYLKDIKDRGTSASDDLRHLKHVVDSLRQGVRVTSFDSDAAKQLREILQLSEDMIFGSRCARVLATLDFDGMTQRYHEVEEAHQTTFEWIFGKSTPHRADSSSSDAVEGTSEGLVPGVSARSSRWFRNCKPEQIDSS